MKILYNTDDGMLVNYPRDDDSAMVGLKPWFQVFNVQQNAPPDYNPATHFLRKTESVDVAGKTVTRGWEAVEIPAPPPVSVDMRSMRLALIEAGLYVPVVAAINGADDPTERLKLQTWWQTSSMVHRASPIVAQLSAALGRTTEQVDAVFTRALAIQAEI